MDHEVALVPFKPSAHTHDHAAPAEGSVLDPVCGMTVDPHTRQASRRASRPPVLFLLGRLPSQIHRRSAEISDQHSKKPPEPVPEGTIYTCPMHPEIRQVGPGSCPICGMALEPELATRRQRAQLRNSPT